MTDAHTASVDGRFLHEDNARQIFAPLQFRHLTVKNWIFRSNLSGTFDDYNGHGSNARVNWESALRVAGSGAIISSFTPVTVRGRILTRYAMIDADDKIPFWRRSAGASTSMTAASSSSSAIPAGSRTSAASRTFHKRARVRPAARTTSTAFWRRR